jgi:hypothetical protein
MRGFFGFECGGEFANTARAIREDGVEKPMYDACWRDVVLYI